MRYLEQNKKLAHISDLSYPEAGVVRHCAAHLCRGVDTEVLSTQLHRLRGKPSEASFHSARGVFPALWVWLL